MKAIVVAAGLAVLIVPAAATPIPASGGDAGLPISLAAFGGHRHNRNGDDARPTRSRIREPEAKPERVEQHRQYLKHYGF